MKKASLTKWLICCMVLWMKSLFCAGQEFTIQSFKTLPNDITAYINPERDLNGEACALVKVVAEKDFAFSTPLGIIKRINETGEIWIYLPKGSRLLTIKHPRWGVLRDYAFPTILESRLTYELIIRPPLNHQIAQSLKLSPSQSKTHLPRHRQLDVPSTCSLLPVPPSKLPWEYLFSVYLGVGKQETLPGFRIGILKHHGVYLGIQSNFKKAPPTIIGTCHEDGFVPEYNYYPYYKEKSADMSCYAVTLGAIHRLMRSLYWYEGVGYGKHTVAWETIQNEWFLNDPLSTQGYSAETGMLIRYRKYHISFGVQTIQTKIWNLQAGFGLIF